MAIKPTRRGAVSSYMKHTMFDAETLGTTADSVIMSIGAVKFDLDSDQIDDEGFYVSISIESNLAAGRKISEPTLKWWLQQERAAQNVFFEPKQVLEDALLSLSEWLGHSKRYVWSNGADFDLPLLAHAYASFGYEPPWEFWNARCVRTYKTLPGVDSLPKPPNKLKHNALADAVAQAQYVQSVQRFLKGAKT